MAGGRIRCESSLQLLYPLVPNGLRRPLQQQPFTLAVRWFGKGCEGRVDKVGEFKSPIIKALWQRRLGEQQMEEVEMGPSKDRKASESRTSVTYQFSDQFLRESYVNPWGYMRKGKLFEDMDAIAGNVAYKHCERNGRVPLLVTASIDRIAINKNPKLGEENMEMSGAVVWTGSSSMQINIHVKNVNETKPWVNAAFTFVARNPKTGKATSINRLLPETEEEKEIFQEVEQKNIKRKMKRKKQQEQKTAGDSSDHEREKLIKLLLQQARPLLEMPCLADPTCILMASTRLSNSTTMQPQQRNMANRIFGGFLARRAYEIAFSSCYLFAGSRPEFCEMLHVDFISPVDVGDLVNFAASILYTKVDARIPSVHVQVIATICRPEEVSSSISNTFNFIFKVPLKATLKKVLPANYDQASRIVDRMEADLSCDD